MRMNGMGLMSCLLAMVLSGCYDAGNAQICADADAGVVPASTCNLSPYAWGEDDVLYVCQNPVPITLASGRGDHVKVADFQFVNYRGLWVNSLTRFCVKSIGSSGLENVSGIDFKTLGGLVPQSTSIEGPWPEDERICADIVLTVGAESVGRLEVLVSTFPLQLAPGAQYQFEITNADDITNSGEQEPILGNFPVQSSVVTIAPASP